MSAANCGDRARRGQDPEFAALIPGYPLYRLARSALKLRARPEAFFVQLLVNGAVLDLPEDSRVSTLIERMQLAGKRLAVELNGEIVARSAHAQTRLQENDRVEIVQAIGGG